MVMWVVTEAAGAALMPGTVPIPEIVWLRYAFHIGMMLVVLGVPCRFSFVRTSRPWLQLVRSLLMLAMPLCYALGGGAARLRDVMGVFWIAPMLVLAMAPLARDRPSRVTWAVTLIAWLGAAVAYRPAITTMGWALVWSAGMAASFAAYVVLTRVLDRTESLLTNLFHTAVGVFVALSVTLPAYWVPVGARAVGAGAMVAICGWVGLWLMDLAVRRAQPSRLAPFLFTQALMDVVRQSGWHLPRSPVALAVVLLLAGLSTAALHKD
jgi:drug/metabolite transporter (DMT)-like permease